MDFSSDTCRLTSLAVELDALSNLGRYAPRAAMFVSAAERRTRRRGAYERVAHAPRAHVLVDRARVESRATTRQLTHARVLSHICVCFTCVFQGDEVCARACVCARVCVRGCVCLCACVRACLCLCVPVRLRALLCVAACACVCACECARVWIRVGARTHARARAFLSSPLPFT